MSTRYAYVDESKRTEYVLAAATVPDPEAARRVIRGLILPGQRHLHMKHEQPRRRRAIVSALVATTVKTTIYDAGRGYPTDLATREARLRALIEDLAKADNGEVQLVIGQDDSLVWSDRHELYRLVRQAGVTEILEYRHRRANEEPLLALPDVVAWCWVRSDDWRRRIKPILTAARSIEP